MLLSSLRVHAFLYVMTISRSLGRNKQQQYTLYTHLCILVLLFVPYDYDNIYGVRCVCVHFLLCLVLQG